MASLRSSDDDSRDKSVDRSAGDPGGSVVVGAFLSLLAGVGFGIMAFVISERPALQLTLIISSAGLLALACILFAWSGAIDAGTRALIGLPGAMLEINAKLADLEAVRREHYKLRTNIESFSKSVETEKELLAAMRSDIEDVLETTLDHHAEIERHRGESNRRGKALEEWHNAAIEYVHGLERALAHAGELSPDAIKAYEKSASDFARLLRPLGIELIRPAPGDEFDDRLHEAAGQSESATVPEGRIVNCRAWGFRSTGGTTRAQVVLAKSSRVVEACDRSS